MFTRKSRSRWYERPPRQELQHIQERHREIARLYVNGYSRNEIAEMLNMSPYTLSWMKRSPAFQQVVEDLRDRRDESAADFSKRISRGVNLGLDLLLNVLTKGTEENNVADIKTKVNVATEFLDRELATSKVSRSNNKSVNFHVTPDDIAALRAQKEVVDV